MKTNTMHPATTNRIHRLCAAAGIALALAATARAADPELTSWFTVNSGKYAQVYASTANRSSGISATTWSGQTLPTYAGVHEIDYSSNWVYIRNSGLASYVMGPWNNPNW